MDRLEEGVEDSVFLREEKEVAAFQSQLAGRGVQAHDYASGAYAYDMPTKLVAIPFTERTSTSDEGIGFVRIVLPDPVPEVISARDATLWAMSLLKATGLANEQLSRLGDRQRSRPEGGASEPPDGDTTSGTEA